MISNHFFLIMRNHYPRNQKYLWIAGSVHVLCVERTARGSGRCLRSLYYSRKESRDSNEQRHQANTPTFGTRNNYSPIKCLEFSSVNFLFLPFQKRPTVLLTHFFEGGICKYTQIIKDSCRAQSNSIHFC